MDTVAKYRIKFVYDRDMSGGSEVEVEIESMRKPSLRLWEDEELGDEVYWKIENDTDVFFIRKSFICAILITKIRDDTNGKGDNSQ